MNVVLTTHVTICYITTSINREREIYLVLCLSLKNSMIILKICIINEIIRNVLFYL